MKTLKEKYRGQTSGKAVNRLTVTDMVIVMAVLNTSLRMLLLALGKKVYLLVSLVFGFRSCNFLDRMLFFVILRKRHNCFGTRRQYCPSRLYLWCRGDNVCFTGLSWKRFSHRQLNIFINTFSLFTLKKFCSLLKTFLTQAREHIHSRKCIRRAPDHVYPFL